MVPKDTVPIAFTRRHIIMGGIEEPMSFSFARMDPSMNTSDPMALRPKCYMHRCFKEKLHVNFI